MDDPTTVLRDLMIAERNALLNGRLADLAELAPAKATALELLPEDSPELDSLSRLAARNAVLLKAAMSGVSAARDRLSGHQQEALSLQTYSSDGRRQSIRTARPQLERRR